MFGSKRNTTTGQPRNIVLPIIQERFVIHKKSRCELKQLEFVRLITATKIFTQNTALREASCSFGAVDTMTEQLVAETWRFFLWACSEISDYTKCLNGVQNSHSLQFIFFSVAKLTFVLSLKIQQWPFLSVKWEFFSRIDPRGELFEILSLSRGRAF